MCICDCAQNVDRDFLADLEGQLVKCGPDHMVCLKRPRAGCPWSVAFSLTVIVLSVQLSSVGVFLKVARVSAR